MSEVDADAPASWELVDCFCGGGLFSFGARSASMQVTNAVDSCPDALSVYKLNFTATKITCASLDQRKAPKPAQ